MGDMPLSLVRQICDQLKAKNTRSIVIEGSGEPFLNPDILEIISTIKAAGFSLTILTNGTLLDRSVTQFLIEKQVDVVKVSLWANSVEGYVENHPGVDPDNFRKVIDGLNFFASLKAERKSRFPEVWIHNPINRYNFRSLHAMVDLAIKARCNGLSYSPLFNFRYCPFGR
jgi:wyosine [tRNA(Phe)-imidazoG37] synthetase (radical SAM superfamily)